MRLIDADALMVAMYHRVFETDEDTMWQSGCWVRYRAIDQVIKEQPSADVVDVVRCKNCKWYVAHYDTDGDVPYWKCNNWDAQTDADGFCYEAEMR